MPSFPDSNPLTLCTETLAVLADQDKTKTYTRTVETYFSPDLSLTDMREKMSLFGSVCVRDYRVRPVEQLHITGSTSVPYAADFIKAEVERWRAVNLADQKTLNAIPYTKENQEARRRAAEGCSASAEREQFYRSLPYRLSSWRPQRLVALDVWLNHHKRAEYEATAAKNPADKFVQQIWSCIRQRCVAMDEANKVRGNPMRNIHIALYFTPDQTYFSADWETSAPHEDKMFGHHATEYRLDDNGEVVCFQSNITIKRIEKDAQDEAKKQADKRAEAERKAKEEADYLASLTHHTDAWGHKFTQEGTKKVTARYDDVWMLDPSDHEDMKKWNDLASVKLMEQVWSGKFLAIRVADYETHSLFVCEAVVVNGKMHAPTNLFTYRIEKGKTGKFKDANKTKQLRVSEKIDLSQFPKVA